MFRYSSFKLKYMSLNFEKSALLPAIIQNASTREVLMLGYMNEEALKIAQHQYGACVRVLNNRGY